MSNPNTTLWKELHWEASSKQIEQLTKLQVLIDNWNKVVNLTRLTEGDDYWILQIVDSLLPLKKELQTPQKLINCIDVGSGCGFPGLAVAIAFPNAKITLVDSIDKKTTCLRQIATDLGLNKQVMVRNERIELTGQNVSFRGSFDLALARAVASAPVLAEYLIPLLNKKGEALLYKGTWENIDQTKLNKALKKLNGTVSNISKYRLPNDLGNRHAIRISPIGPCPIKYPRAIGKPNKNPLGD